MADYDIGEAFRRIEEEMIASMMRNLDRHRAEEEEKGYNWSMWQTEQLKALEQYRQNNLSKYSDEFKSINSKISGLITMARAEGNMDQEAAILSAIKKGFKANRKSKDAMTGAFFRLNDKKLEALIKATTDDFEKAELAMLRRADDQYRKIIFNAQVYANTGAATYEKAVDMATKDFLAAGINCVEYKNGSRHSISDYADMCIKTATKRAYLTGEGEKRKEWGISTVIMNKRGNPCPKCLPFVGKILIDDVWSGGKPEDGPYMLMSKAVEAGLYHPRCKDSHTTYFDFLNDEEDNKVTDKEKSELIGQYNAEQKENYFYKQEQKCERMAKYSLDTDNKRMYKARTEKWKQATNEEIMASQEYRPINRSSEVIAQDRGAKTITMRKVENSTYEGDILISDSVKLKPKQMHNIETSLKQALKVVGGGSNPPKCLIITTEEMQTGAICSYYAVNNVIYIDSAIGDVDKLLELQVDMACPKNPLSTYVHEMLHWKDAEEYRKKNSITSQIKYLEDLRTRHKKKLDNLQKQGYNIFNISEYASERYYSGIYDETMTEYNVLVLLGKGD